MTNDLKNFLEGEKEEFESQFVTKNTNDWDRLKGVRSQEPLNWINDVILDTHNFVLDLVEKEVGNKKRTINNLMLNDLRDIEYNKALEDISTIINNLRV